MNILNTVRNIYDHIGDDLSKKLYEYRLIYSFTRNENIVNDIITAQMADVFSMIDTEKFDCYIYGAGFCGKAILKIIGSDCKGFIDTDPDIHGKTIDEHKVFSPDIIPLLPENARIIISSSNYFEEIENNIINMKISADKIINIGKDLHKIFEYQYFDLDELYHAQDECFVDAGCYDGFSSLQFTKWSGEFMHIYAFEPDEKNQRLIKGNLGSDIMNKTTIFNTGLWSEATKLRFSQSGNMESRIAENKECGTTIDVSDMDSLLTDKRVTFIKMDIEGAELKALTGAKKIISEQKPKLAISVYHKPEDIIELPELILSYNPDYKLYFRHYSLCMSETVLYAI